MITCHHNTTFNNQEGDVYSSSSLFRKEQMNTLQKLFHHTMLTAEKGSVVIVIQRSNYLHALNTTKEKTKSQLLTQGLKITSMEILLWLVFIFHVL